MACGSVGLLARSIDTANADGESERLPGEFQLTSPYRLVDSRREGRWLTRDRLPTIMEVAERVARKQIEPLVIFALYEDDSNHFVPTFSPDGRSVSFLTADIERRTAKQRIIGAPGHDGESLLVFPENPGSYDYMLTWGQWASRQDRDPQPFVLASQHRRGVMDLYMGADVLEMPSLLLAGEKSEIPKHPALLCTASGWKLAWELAGKVLWAELRASDLAGDAWDLGDPQLLGPGRQPEWSPDGSWMICTRPPISGDYQRDGDQVVAYGVDGGETRVLLAASPGRRLRDARLDAASGDLLVHLVQTSDENTGAELGVLTINPDNLLPGGALRVVLDDVLVQPHFDSHPIATTSRGGMVLAFQEAANSDGYNPIRWARLDGSTRGEIHHSDEFTTAQDIAVDPDPNCSTLAFSAAEGLSQGIFVMILNHWGEADD